MYHTLCVKRSVFLILINLRKYHRQLFRSLEFYYVNIRLNMTIFRTPLAETLNILGRRYLETHIGRYKANVGQIGHFPTNIMFDGTFGSNTITGIHQTRSLVFTSTAKRASCTWWHTCIPFRDSSLQWWYFKWWIRRHGTLDESRVTLPI